MDRNRSVETLPVRYLFHVRLSSTFSPQLPRKPFGKLISQPYNPLPNTGPGIAVVDDIVGHLGFFAKVHLRRYGLRRFSSGNPVSSHDPATLGAAARIHHQHRIDLALPTRLVQQGNFNQNQRFQATCRRMAHRLAGQGVQQTVELTTKMRLAKKSFPQSNPINRAVSLQKDVAKGCAEGQPTRLVNLEQAPATLIHVHKRRQTVTCQQATDATFTRPDAASDAKQEGLQDSALRNASSMICISAQSGAIKQRSAPVAGWCSLSELACSS